MPASVSPGTAQGGRPLRPDRSPRPATPSSDTMSLHLRNVTRGGRGGSIPLLGDRCWVPELRAKGSTHENTLQPNLLQGIFLRSWLPGQDASRTPLAAKYPVRVGVPTVTVLIKPIWRGTRSQTRRLRTVCQRPIRPRMKHLVGTSVTHWRRGCRRRLIPEPEAGSATARPSTAGGWATTSIIGRPSSIPPSSSGASRAAATCRWCTAVRLVSRNPGPIRRRDRPSP